MFEILAYQFQVDIYLFCGKIIQALKTQTLTKMLEVVKIFAEEAVLHPCKDWSRFIATQKILPTKLQKILFVWGSLRSASLSPVSAFGLGL